MRLPALASRFIRRPDQIPRMTASDRKITLLGHRKRQQILQMAATEFEQYGYEGARIQRIADRAGVPKANVHYYFASKSKLYDAVLSDVVDLWNAALAPIHANADPATVLESYIRMKVDLTRLYPGATRIFAQEMLGGGLHLSGHLKRETREWTEKLAAEIEHWIRQGKILPVDPFHLIFVIWSTTQYFAESGTQIRSIYRKKSLTKQDHDRLAESLVTMVFRICGLKTTPERHRTT